MNPNTLRLNLATDPINRAFSKQSVHYDEDDRSNVILQQMRQQVYDHVAVFIKQQSRILELNAGTGIDALHFVSEGHTVHAIDIAEGMITQINSKIAKHQLHNQLTCEQRSYAELDQINQRNFDYVFSNFGGLNCIEELSAVTKHLKPLLKNDAYVTWVVMPPFSAWEFLSVLNGSPSTAFRRLKKGGTIAHLEGEHFQTYYHSLSNIKEAFGPSFRFIKSEGLAALTPPPHRGDFPEKHPVIYKNLKALDSVAKKHFPFNRWADHIIVTFRFNGK